MNYEFTTGDEKFSHSRLMSIKFDPKSKPTEEDFTEFAYHKSKAWFAKRYTESTLTHVICEPAIEGTLDEVTVTRAAQSDPLEDGYSAEMSLDRIDQLIGEMKPYTDRVVLNGWASPDTIRYFAGRPGHPRYYVNTFEDPDNHDRYTVIKWG